MVSTTAAAESARATLALLWRHQLPAANPRPGPKPRTSVDAVVAAAVTLADDHGIAAVSMRSLAAALGLRPMAIYGYVSGREQLITLMIDAVADDRAIAEAKASRRACATAIADRARAEYRRHPWLLDVPAWRPVLGPNESRRYEHQVAALEGSGLDDVAIDQLVNLLTAFAAANVRTERDARAAAATSGLSDAQWWQINGPFLDELMPASDYPVSSRVGTAAGQFHQAPGNTDYAYDFGLGCLLDGLERAAGAVD